MFNHQMNHLFEFVFIFFVTPSQYDSVILKLLAMTRDEFLLKYHLALSFSKYSKNRPKFDVCDHL